MTVVEFEQFVKWYRVFDKNPAGQYMAPEKNGWWKITLKERQVIRAVARGQQ